MTPGAKGGVRTVATRLGGPGVTAATLLACAAIAGAVMLPGLAAAILTPSPTPVVFAADASQDQAARMETYRKQIDGRTMFFVPAKPTPPPPVVEVKNDETSKPTTPPPPSSYGGPAPIALIFDTVWFADGQKLKAGDEAKGDLGVVRLEAPWSAILKWKGVEFTVKVFDRDSVVLKAPGQKMAEGTPPEPKPTPPPEAAAPAPAATPPATGAAPPAADETSQPPPEPPADPEGNR